MAATDGDTPRRLTCDYRYRYRGHWTDGGVCRVRVYEAPGATPVLLVTELPENENTSVTNMAEYLAAELIARHFPHRFEDAEPVIWVEHYPQGRGQRETYDRVIFASYVPMPCFSSGVWRVRLGEPMWRPIARDSIAHIVGLCEEGERSV